MKRIMRKLRSRKGETITETLIGMLIVAMASVVLVTGITASIKVNERTKKAGKENEFKYVDAENSPVNSEMIISGIGTENITIKVKEHTDNNYVWFTAK